MCVQFKCVFQETFLTYSKAFAANSSVDMPSVDSCTPHMAPLLLTTIGLDESSEQSWEPSLHGFCVCVCVCGVCV